MAKSSKELLKLGSSSKDIRRVCGDPKFKSQWDGREM